MFERRFFEDQFLVEMSEMRRERLRRRETKPLPVVSVSDETRAFQEHCRSLRARIEGLTEGSWE